MNLTLKLCYVSFQSKCKIYCQKYFVILPMSEWEQTLFAKRQLQTTKWNNTKIHCKTAGGIPSQIGHLQELCIPCKSIQRSRWWLLSSPDIYHKCICRWNEPDRNARRSDPKKFQSVPLHSCVLLTGSRKQIPRTYKTSVRLVSVFSATFFCEFVFTVM